MKVYRAHNCGRRHQAWPALARCMWRHAAWISGDGPWAVIAWCGVASVSLHEDPDAADLAIERVDATGCGSQCTGRHELVRLAFGEVTS